MISTHPDANAKPATSMTEAELTSQPDIWARALKLPSELLSLLPSPGQRAVGVGCGTSFYMLDSWARIRQGLGLGHTRATFASEYNGLDGADVAVFLSRSGTTGDLVRLAEQLDGVRRVAITGTPDSPITKVTDAHVLLDFADEESVVQTRFATTALTLLRRACDDGEVAGTVDAARNLLASAAAIDPARYDHFVFLGTDWTLGLAHEAALKLRESALLWTEAYPVQEYLHGPIACASERTLVWSFSPVPEEVANVIAATGASLRIASQDPQVELVEVHRTGVAYAQTRNIDCDTPPHLSRSVTA